MHGEMPLHTGARGAHPRKEFAISKQLVRCKTSVNIEGVLNIEFSWSMYVQ